MTYLGNKVVIQEDVGWSGQHGVWGSVLGLCLQEGVWGETRHRAVVEFRGEVNQCHCHLWVCDVCVGVGVGGGGGGGGGWKP